MKWYYTMIADILHPVENKKEGWKPTLFILLTAWIALNMLTLSLAIQLLTGYNPINEFLLWLPTFRSGHTYLIIQLIPCICIVYFSIFYKKRYIYISRKYHKHGNGKLFLIYLIVSPILFFGLALLRDYLLKVGPFSG